MAKYRKLGRTADQRKALLRNQVTNLLYHGRIVTTETKAKEVRKIADGDVYKRQTERSSGYNRRFKPVKDSGRSCKTSWKICR